MVVSVVSENGDVSLINNQKIQLSDKPSTNIEKSSYSQTLDELFSGVGKISKPKTRLLIPKNQTDSVAVQNFSNFPLIAIGGKMERPITRHGSRSVSNENSSQNLSSSSSSSASSRAVLSGLLGQCENDDEVNHKFKEEEKNGFQKCSKVTESQVNFWSRDKEKDKNLNYQIENNDDAFAKNLHDLENRSTRTRSLLSLLQGSHDISHDNSQSFLTKNPSVILEKNETVDELSSTSKISSASSTSNNDEKLLQNSIFCGGNYKYKMTSPKMYSKVKSNNSTYSKSTFSYKIRDNDPKTLSKENLATDTFNKNNSINKMRNRSTEKPPTGLPKSPNYEKSKMSRAKSAVILNKKPKGTFPFVNSTSNFSKNKMASNSHKQKVEPSLCLRNKSSLPGKAASLPESSVNANRVKNGSFSASFLRRHYEGGFEIWLKQKIEAETERKILEKKKQEEEERKKEEKKQNAKKCFKKWKEEHDRYFITERQKKLEIVEETKQKQKEEQDEKRHNAELTYKHWKKTQVEMQKSQQQQIEIGLKTRTLSVSKQKLIKKEEAEKAFVFWMQEKQKQKRNEANKIQELQLEEQERAKREKDYKQKMAQESYNLWLQMKHEEMKYTKSLAFKIMEFETEAKRRWPSTPWLPTGNTVTRQFVGTGNRRKTLEKPVYLIHSKRTNSCH